MKPAMAATGLALCGLAACAGQNLVDQRRLGLAEPRVVMLANPAPPYTYWAPEGATIRNHPTQPGVWIAEVGGEPGPYYFGDRCGAARRQAWVGHPIAEFQGDLPANARVYSIEEVVTSNLVRDRLNVLLDRPGGVVRSVDCN